METITIEGDRVEARSPEGQRATLGVAEWLDLVEPERLDTGDLVLPDGVKSVISEGPVTIWVHQTPPCVYSFKWIAKGSPAPFGRGTKYREIRIALPYLMVLAVFVSGKDEQMTLSHTNECFFRTEPLSDLGGELYYPGLLNCSKFDPPDGHPLSWICTQHLERSLHADEPDANRRMRLQFRALMHCLLETGFNYSSEHHEASSWFTESTSRDPRIASVERWQAESEKDPFFVLDVAWLPVGASVRDVACRILANHHVARDRPRNAASLARLIFNHGAPCISEAEEQKESA